MANGEISIQEHEFRVSVLTKLTELTTETSGINARLDRLNGSVARHEKRLGELETTNAEHAAAEEATAKEDKKYRRWLDPLSRYALVCFVALVLERGPQILASFRGAFK